MSEKRFKSVIDEDTMSIMPYLVSDKEEECFYNLEGCVDLLNEQQELIEELHLSDHMGWGRAEKFEKELKQKKIYIKRLEYKVQKFKEMNSEQQATIRKLQDLCGESDGENAKLRQEIKELKAQLREKEEDERLYANEIVKLNKEAKEVLDFKSLGGDY